MELTKLVRNNPALSFKPVFRHVVGSTIEDSWISALREVMTGGRKYIIGSGSFEKTRRKTLPMIIEMHTPGSRPLAPLTPPGMSIAPPTTDDKIHEYFEYLVSPEKKPNEHYTYGEDLWWQVEYVIAYYLRYGHDTACCYMGVGRPESLLFYSWDADYYEHIIVADRITGEMRTRNITNVWNKNPQEEVSAQCLRGIDTWIEGNRLNFMCYFRAQDLWGGFPENYGGIQLLKEYMAGCIGVDDGVLIASGKDLHVYQHAWSSAYGFLHMDVPPGEQEEMAEVIE